MRRVIGTAAVIAAVIAVIVFGLGAGSSGSSGTYLVRAMFDNAGYAAPGEQVRIAGAPVGSILSESVIRRGSEDLAAVTLKITAKGFTPWHANATCAIRPESLIAERFVDCSPGTAAKPELALIRSGAGAGSHLLGVSQTSSPIDPDIVQDISTEPVREGLATIIDELGTGLAARGADLNAVIRRADPGLAATDKVFSLLASQNKTLAQLATDSNTVLAPLAKAKTSLAQFVVGADATANASATQSAAISRSIKDLPGLLSQLKPLMSDLGDLAQQGTPDLSNLGKSAAGLDKEFTDLVPFASRARTALNELSTAASKSQANLEATTPLAKQLSQLGSAAEPAASSLSSLTTSLSKTNAITQLMQLLYNGTGATNGFDSDGHYLRTDLIVGSCTAYARTAVSGCSANFDGNPGGSSFVKTEVAKATEELAKAASGSGTTAASTTSTSGAASTSGATSTSAATSTTATPATATATSAERTARAVGKSDSTVLASLLAFLTGDGK